jgi:hypothetical protein
MQDKDRKRPLVRITNPELDEALADRQLIISEIEALDHDSEADPGALQVVTRRIRELIGDVDAIEVCNHWRVYNTEGTWSGLDQERLKNEFPEAYQKCYISRRATGKRRLKVYALGEGGKVM